MKLRSRRVLQFADFVGRVFGRLAALIVGFIMTVVGLGMTTTIVMLPIGIPLGLLGVAIFVGGLFAPDDSTERPGD